MGDDGVVVGEVELSVKSPKRLQAILKAWGQISWAKEVRYHCVAGATYCAVCRKLDTIATSTPVYVFELPVL